MIPPPLGPGSGFSSAAFEPVAQPVVGFRAFRIGAGDTRKATLYGAVPAEGTLGIAPAGVLTGIFMDEYLWGPGANTAICLVGGVEAAARRRLIHRPPEMRHCVCGFWAYTNGQRVVSVPDYAVLGMIEGWGRIVIGPHGFRAEYARILALCFPEQHPGGDSAAVTMDAAEPVIRDATEGAKARIAWLVKMFQWRLGGLGDAGSVPAPPRVEIVRSTRPWENVPQDLQSAVRRRYPAAQMFDTVAAMQKAFPPTDLTPMLPRVESPEDS